MAKVNPQKLVILRIKKVLERTGLPRSSMYLQMQEGAFPEQINLGPRSVGWLEHEIDDWVAERVRQRDSGRRRVR